MIGASESGRERLRAALDRAVSAPIDADDATPAFVIVENADPQQAPEWIAAERAAGRPVGMAFVGVCSRADVSVVRELLEADPDLPVVLCADQPDQDWDELLTTLRRNDQVVLLRSPYDPAEIRQMALSLLHKRELARRAALTDEEIRALAAGATERLQEQIKRRAEMEDELRFMAFHDQVTGLPNRAYLLDRIGQCIHRSLRIPGYRFAVLFLDLDNFKLINDTMGHDHGDMLLRDAAQRLRNGLRSIDAVARTEEDVAARVGGDEFIVLLEGLRDLHDSVIIARRLLEMLVRPFRLEGREVTVGASIGIATSERRYVRAEEVLRDADTAMYRAKGSGKGRYAVFDPEMHDAAKRRLEIESKLRAAITSEQLEVAYQPIIDVRSGEMVAFEALFRCHLPGLDASPREVIGVAEETGLLVPLGRWVFRRACKDFMRWLTIHPHVRRLRIGVNISRRELNDEDLITTVRGILSETGIPAGQVCIEITESGIIEHGEAAMRALRGFRDLGVQLHMDDFGTGYSSLACLHTFPLDAVKIDRAFTATMTHDRRYVAVVEAIVTLCRALGMRVTVEGIETPEQLELVTSLGCDWAQGFLFARPMSAKAVDELLARTPDLYLAA